jgi:signal transduction histidine kinase/CheY-like chemotaxis protein
LDAYNRRAVKDVTVLLVEDEPAHERLVRELLRESKDLTFKVVRAQKLSQALQHLSWEPFDVVLLDLMLPDEKGLATLEKIRGQAPDLPVVVLTAIDDPELILGAAQRGAQDYLIKRRLDVDLLVRTIRYAIERKRAQERQGKLNRLFQNLGPDFLVNMEMIVETGREILGGDHMDYCRMDRRGLLCRLSTAPQDELVICEEEVENLYRQVMTMPAGEHLIIDDLRETTLWESNPFVRNHQFKSMLGYPVLVKKRLVGALTLFSAERRQFTDEDVSIMAILARTLSIEEERLAREEDLKEFIDIASHELRHPVTIIKGYAVSLRELHTMLDMEKMSELLEAIEYGADRLNSLVMELLDVSRIERGHFHIQRREMELKPLLEEAIGRVGSRSKSNHFTFEVSGEIPVLKADPEKVSEALQNLLDNAVIYSPAASEINLMAEVRGGEVIVSVVDRGIGVPEEYRESIFERFGQVEDALHHSSPGLGIGLYVSKEIIEAHGGRIWHEPRPDGGSIFTFTLPLD